MLKRNFDGIITKIDGEPFYRQRVEGNMIVPILDKDNKPIPMTVRQAIIDALVGNFPGDENLSSDAKFKRHLLAETIHNKGKPGDTELSIDDAALIKEACGKNTVTSVMRPIFLALEKDPTAAAPTSNPDA